MKSPCYEAASLNMSVKNPFEEDGVFKVILLEMPEVPSAEEAEMAKKKKKQKGKAPKDSPATPDPGQETGHGTKLSPLRIMICNHR